MKLHLAGVLLVLSCTSPSAPPQPAPQLTRPAAAIANPAAIVHPDGCFDICSSNFECSHSLGTRCGICSFGHCTNINPEALPGDAGVDGSASTAGPASPADRPAR